jgi:hypothetical protein
MAATAFSAREGSSAHGASTSDRLCHSQRRRSANPRVRRSGRPRPPKSRGEQATVQATRQRPPETVSVPAQTNALRRLSISLMAQGEREQQMETCTGMADKVVFRLPAVVSKPSATRDLAPPAIGDIGERKRSSCQRGAHPSSEMRYPNI